MSTYRIVAEISYTKVVAGIMERALLMTRIPESFEGCAFASRSDAERAAARRNRPQGVVGGTYDLETGCHVGHQMTAAGRLPDDGRYVETWIRWLAI